jgi:hypothetical protein
MSHRPGPRLGGSVVILLLLLLAPDAARAQRSVADLLGRPAAPEGTAKTYLEELTLYSYIENTSSGTCGRPGAVTSTSCASTTTTTATRSTPPSSA